MCRAERGDELAQIATDGISKSYGSVPVLTDIRLEVRDGEFLTLLGPSGSGKTTLLMILAGFVRPSAGNLFKNHEDITDLPAERRNFGMVFQGYALFPHLTVRQNITYPLRVRRILGAERQARVERIIETVGLGAHGEKKPSQLSGGQQQRVALARALVFEPDLLLLDEPLSALDRNMREQLQMELKRLHRETGTTFVFVTHDQGEALALSDKIAIFSEGRLVQCGAPTEIYREPETRFVAEFLGNVNILPLEDVVQEGSCGVGRFAGRKLKAPLKSELNGFGNCCMAVRPEDMRLAGDKPSNGENALQVALHDFTYQGATTGLVLKTECGLNLSYSLPDAHASAGFHRGERFWITWPGDKGRILTG